MLTIGRPLIYIPLAAKRFTMRAAIHGHYQLPLRHAKSGEGSAPLRKQALS
ncbi:MAG TPA: hypothetical protein VF014_12395 [Casimicrobiaceae bacterium]|nr:hypothetical protein [Casimicrobiaceae bacterium]